MILLVGLGNPGKQYEHTRHNMGRILVERWARDHGADFAFNKNFDALIPHPFVPSPRGERPAPLLKDDEAGIHKIICLTPETFMNNSGESVQAITHFYKIEPQNIWIVTDDLNLEFGVIRTRQSGTDGGHNGLNSVIEKMGTNLIPRIRIGIGSNGIIPAEDYVLQKFTDDELRAIQSDVYSKFLSLIFRSLTSHFPTDTIA